MYDEGLNYIARAYRWGELEEQQVETPDYTAHITSFHLFQLRDLFEAIRKEPDLKGIPFLWIDAISVAQQNSSKKKETILQMSQIYKMATYILAVPDLHFSYLLRNPANMDIIKLMDKYKETIYKQIITNEQSSNKNRKEEEDIKRVYRFLEYLIKDWSNRAWVINEYHIAKEKQEKKETLLKYIFISLLTTANSWKNKYFFSYSFDHQHTAIKDYNNIKIPIYKKIDSCGEYMMFFKSNLQNANI